MEVGYSWWKGCGDFINSKTRGPKGPEVKALSVRNRKSQHQKRRGGLKFISLTNMKRFRGRELERGGPPDFQRTVNSLLLILG